MAWSRLVVGVISVIRKVPTNHEQCPKDRHDLVAFERTDELTGQGRAKHHAHRERSDYQTSVGRGDGEHALQEERQVERQTHQHHHLQQREQNGHAKDLVAQEIQRQDRLGGFAFGQQKQGEEHHAGCEQSKHLRRTPGRPLRAAPGQSQHQADRRSGTEDGAQEIDVAHRRPVGRFTGARRAMGGQGE